MGYYKQKKLKEDFVMRVSTFIQDEIDYELFIKDMEEQSSEYEQFSHAANKAKAKIRAKKIQSRTANK